MARSRKQTLSPASYPSARLVRWLREQGAVLREHTLAIVIVGSLLGVGSVGGGAWLVWANYQYDQGLIHFRTGLAAIEASEYGQAIDDLTRAEAALRGESRDLATLHLGEAYEKNDQAADAKAAYERATTRDDVAGYIEQLAFLRLGHGAEQAEDLDAAESWYREASIIEGPSSSEALLALGEILEKMEGGRPPQPYLDLLKKFPDTPFAKFVEARIAIYNKNSPTN